MNGDGLIWERVRPKVAVDASLLPLHTTPPPHKKKNEQEEHYADDINIVCGSCEGDGNDGTSS